MSCDYAKYHTSPYNYSLMNTIISFISQKVNKARGEIIGKYLHKKRVFSRFAGFVTELITPCNRIVIIKFVYLC